MNTGHQVRFRKHVCHHVSEARDDKLVNLFLNLIVVNINFYTSIQIARFTKEMKFIISSKIIIKYLYSRERTSFRKDEYDLNIIVQRGNNQNTCCSRKLFHGLPACQDYANHFAKLRPPIDKEI